MPEHSMRERETADLPPFDLRDALRVVRRHRGMVLGFAAAGLAIAAFTWWRAEPVFRATAVIRLADARRPLTGGLIEPSGPTPTVLVNPILSQLEVLRSRSIVGAVVDSAGFLRVHVRDMPPALFSVGRLDPQAPASTLQLTFDSAGVVVRGEGSDGERRASYGVPIAVDGLIFTVARAPEVPTARIVVSSREQAIDLLLKHLTLKPRANTDVIDVTYTAVDPQRAKEVANRIVEAFQAANVADAQEQSRRRREFIESQLRVNDSLLASARQTLAAFRNRRYLDGATPVQARAEVSDAVTQRQALLTERQRYRSVLTAVRASSKPRELLPSLLALQDVAASADVQGWRVKLLEYENARDSLTTGRWARSPQHPDVQRLDGLIDGAQSRLLAAATGAGAQALSILDARLAALASLGTVEADAFRRVTATEGEAARLEGQVEMISWLGDQLREEQQKARVAEAVAAGSVQILDLAESPTPSDEIPLPRRLVFGLLMGLLLGCGGAMLTDHLSPSIRRQDQVRRLGLPVLGVIPHVNGRGGPSQSKDGGPVVEAFRGLRLNLMHAYGAARPLVVAVTSPGSGEGKSFVSANLALAFAHAGRRTVLVDADVRRGVLHRDLKLARTPGLTDGLSGEAEWDKVIQRTSHELLNFVASGTRRPDAPELLDSAAMTQLVTTLRNSASVIVVDTPPLAAGVDAYELATALGHLVLVLRLGTTDSEMAQAKLEVLERLPVRLVGTVLNDARENEGYREYYYNLEGYALDDERKQTRAPISSPR